MNDENWIDKRCHHVSSWHQCWVAGGPMQKMQKAKPLLPRFRPFTFEKSLRTKSVLSLPKEDLYIGTSVPLAQVGLHNWLQKTCGCREATNAQPYIAPDGKSFLL